MEQQTELVPGGILLVDKPAGFTSFDVVAKMRGIAKTRKIGHGGTLDPMATGVLPLFLGSATKACDLLPDQTKAYVASFELGTVTDTQDSTGKVLKRSEVHATEAELLQVLQEYHGEMWQLPPMYSAVSVSGRRLYEYAREGKEVPREKRKITIYECRLVDKDPENHRYSVFVSCSKGTYIRSICHEIGEKLGCGAVMTALRRTVSSGFRVEDALELSQVQDLAHEGTLGEHILPVELAFAAMPRLVLQEDAARKFVNGVKLEAEPSFAPQENIVVFREDGKFVGVGYPKDGKLRVRRIFARLE